MSSRHSLRWWTSGNPDGPHLLILHGGPGGRSSVRHRALTDPARWHITQFDQRGCGESEPRGGCHDNGMDQTVLDIERLREHLRVPSWAVLGPSWGSTVALAYAARFPDAVDALVLTGLFMGTRAEKAFIREGAGARPPAWSQFTALLDPSEMRDVPSAYRERIHDATHPQHDPALRGWMAYDAARSGITLRPERVNTWLDRDRDGIVGSLKIESHYAAHGYFLPDEGILGEVNRVKAPVLVIQGRRDTFGLNAAHALAEVLPGIDLKVVNAGHSALEEGIRGEIRKALEGVRDRAATGA
ncbi:alpha/beta fold hydrolase [Streptomyces lavendulae]|uniref:alpha/beta fold hydrolase n=1 Tax=Streptomyces lavendulae TaxID=1914 RepID=UPI0038223E36